MTSATQPAVEANTSPIPSNIFIPRINIKPYEYPHLLKYVDAIRHSYWLSSEYNYTPDIQDMKVNMTKVEAATIERTMLAISQIESAVKSFWGKVGDHIPKPEVSKVGATFSECEVRHEDAYSELLEKLGLNERFENIKNVPALYDRINYISKINTKAKNSPDPKDYFKSIIFFSILIENVSLFSQFFIIMSMNKHKNVLKGISNAVVRIPMEQKIFHESDNLAFTIQKGEIPAILEYDAVGKVIFPYMSYAFAMNQKVLRRVWNRDSAAGLAILMAAQFPIAMMVAASINIRKGEEPDKDLAIGTLRAMTTLGIWNYPMELLMNGVGSNGVTAMTPFSKTYNLVGDIISGDVTPRSIKENTVLNSAVFLDPLIAAMEE